NALSQGSPPMRTLQLSSTVLLLATIGCYAGLDGRKPVDGGGGIHVNFDPPQDGDGEPNGSGFDPATYFAGIDAEFLAAGDEFGVPPQILQALAFTETQWQMVEGVSEFDGQDP